MKTDGNFVVYNANNVPVWDSGTEQKGGIRLILQGDGNLVTNSFKALYIRCTY
jgi:hypothetical protein